VALILTNCGPIKNLALDMPWPAVLSDRLLRYLVQIFRNSIEVLNIDATLMSRYTLDSLCFPGSKLKSLQLFGAVKVRNLDFAPKNLEELAVISPFFDLPPGRSLLSSTLPSLTGLNLRLAVTLTDTDLVTIANHCPKLTRLGIDQCALTSDVGMKYVLHVSKFLTGLSCKKTPITLQAFAEQGNIIVLRKIACSFNEEDKDGLTMLIPGISFVPEIFDMWACPF